MSSTNQPKSLSSQDQNRSPMLTKALTAGLALMMLCAVGAQGVTPQEWVLARLGQFLEGKFSGISVSDEGILSLAPKEDLLEGPSEEFYLSVLKGQNGDLFLGTGHSGNIYKVGRDGKAEMYFHVPEMDVYCLAQDARGNLYAGTSPNGKIYKVTATGVGEPFFDPEERYIWDMLFLDGNLLLAAVGEQGGIYTITSQGEGTQMLKAEENHILCLHRTPEGAILAGSGGKGRLYRLERDKTPAILFESPYDEIRALTLDQDGRIYAAAGGTIVRPEPKLPTAPASPAVSTEVSITVTPQGVSPAEAVAGEKNQPGALYRINSEGQAKKVWESDSDLIYTLLWDENRQRILFGTGNRGRIFSIDGNDKVSLLLQKDSEQVYSLLAGDSRVYTLANNPQTVSLLYPEQRARGEYQSRVFDAGMLSTWGRIEWDAVVETDTSIQVQTRSGNADQPDQTWSNWSPPYEREQGEQILNPKARYLQFKLLFKTDSGRASPAIRKVAVFYQQDNVAPRISQFEVLPVNTVFLEPPVVDDKILGLDLGPAAEAKKQAASSVLVMPKSVERKGYQTVVWQAADANGDGLLYDISIRNRQEDEWRLLKAGLTQKIFAFETLTLPDGEYELQLSVHDSPSNPVGREQRVEKISRPFVIDNSLPLIGGLRANRSGSRLSLQFFAQDAFSRIKEVRYLIRPGEWRILFPEDGICDALREQFQVSVTLAPDTDNMVTLMVIDEHGNVGVQRSTF
jgi:hypothetical protein